MKKVGRPKKLDRPIPMQVNLPQSVHQAFMNQLGPSPRKGKQSEIVTRLIRQWVRNQELPPEDQELLDTIRRVVNQ